MAYSSTRGRPRKKATGSATPSSLASSPDPPAFPRSDGDADSIAPEDSASQVPSSIPSRRSRAAERNYDADDLTDVDLSDEENNLRRARREYHAAFYKEFKKPVLEWHKDGTIVYTTVKGSSVPIYVFECLQCGKLLKRNASSNTTSNLLNHARDCALMPNILAQQGTMRSFVSGSTYKREKLRTLTTLWVTRNRRPFKIVADPEFHEIIHLLNPSAYTHSATTQARDVKRLYKLSRNKTRIFLASTTGVVHVALNVWTDLNMVPWLGIICYLVHSGQYKRFVLDFIRIRGSHTGVTLAKALYDCLQDYKIHLQLLGLAADSASNNNTLVDSLATRIGPSGRFQGKLHCIRCFAHVLNLVMRAFLRVFLWVKKSTRAEGTTEEWKSLEKEVMRYEVDDSDNKSENSDGELEGEDEDGDDEVDRTPIDPDFDAVRNAADSQMIDECEDGEKCTGTHLNDDIELPPLSVEERKQARVLLAKAIGLSKTVQNSSLNSEAWETKSKELNVTLLTLVKVIDTHWNSHAHCLLRILDRQAVVTQMCTDRHLKLRQYTFSGEEWTILEQLEDILETFIAATEKISKAEVALVFEVIPLIDKFTTMFGHMIDDTTLHISICHAANTALTVLNKYYSFTDDSEIYRIAMILHPRYKTFYFHTVGWEQSWIDEALQLLRHSWTSHYKPTPTTQRTGQSAVASTSQTQPGSRRSKISFEVMIDYGQTDPSAADALEAWLASSALPYENDPIGYHSKQREAAKAGKNWEGEAFARMCLDYLSAPATSVDAERLFSFSGGTVTKLRNQLSEDSAHAAVMVGQWAGNPDLIAATEFEAQLVENWSRKKKRKANAPAEGQSAPKVIVVVDDGGVE